MKSFAGKLSLRYDTIRYDTIAEFNVDSQTECVQLNLAHVARKKYKKKLKPPLPLPT